MSVQDRGIQKINETIDAWIAYKVAWEAAHNGISSVANTQIQALRAEIELLKEETDRVIDNTP